MSRFDDIVYQITTLIPRGKVTTYGAIAAALTHYGRKAGASRAVGQALNRNPHAPTVPCHRVVRSNGALGGYAFGLRRKKELLEAEGVPCSEERVPPQTMLLERDLLQLVKAHQEA